MANKKAQMGILRIGDVCFMAHQSDSFGTQVISGGEDTLIAMLMLGWKITFRSWKDQRGLKVVGWTAKSPIKNDKQRHGMRFFLDPLTTSRRRYQKSSVLKDLWGAMIYDIGDKVNVKGQDISFEPKPTSFFLGKRKEKEKL